MPVAPFDQATQDAIRGNVEVSILASAVRSASTPSADLTNLNALGAIFYFNVSAVPGTDTVQFTIEGKDPASGNYGVLFSATAIATVAQPARYVVYPGVSGAGPTAVAPVALPRTYRVRIVHSAGTNFTYSVGCAYLL